MTRVVLYEYQEGQDRDAPPVEIVAEATVEASGDDMVTLWVTKTGQEGFATPGIEMSASQARSVGQDLLKTAEQVAYVEQGN